MEAHVYPTSALAPSEAPAAPIRAAARGEWRTWSLLMLALLAFYGLLWNPHWVPGGDSDFYIAIARNLALGRGYTWNGTPVGIAPPGWPLVLAAAMKISPAFGFLKLLPMLCMTGFWGVSYWTLRRFVPVRRAVIVILLCGCISHVYSLTFWLHSDALFCLLCAGAILLAQQINEGRPMAWRLPVLLALCAASVTVRWVGVANWLIVAGALLQGRNPFKWSELREELRSMDRRWVTLVLAGIVTIGSFGVVRGRHVSRRDNEPVASPLDDEGKNYDFVPGARGSRKERVEATKQQILGAGKWSSWLFWQPFRFGSAFAALDYSGAALGWALTAVYALAVERGIRNRQWIWLAVGLYCAALCLGWPNPNARYLVPLLPLMMLGIMEGISLLAPESAAPRRRRVVSVLNVLFIGSIAVCNLALWAIDVVVAHSPDFYAVYEGGLNQDLIAAGHYLGQLPLGPDEIGVSGKYVNLNRWRTNHYGLRVTVLLTDDKVRAVEDRLCIQPGVKAEDDEMVLRLYDRGIHYYLYQPPVNPWRVWHFRVPAWLQERLMHGIPHDPITGDTAGWQLWEMSAGPPPQHPGEHSSGMLKRIPLPRVRNWPDRVPGM